MKVIRWSKLNPNILYNGYGVDQMADDCQISVNFDCVPIYGCGCLGLELEILLIGGPRG